LHASLEDYLTPDQRHGMRMYTRDDTSDKSVVHSITLNDEYGLSRMDLEGWAIDIGAHIGSVCVPLAIMNPRLRIIAVEPLPENVDILRRNIEINNLGDRVTVIEGAISDHDGETTVLGDYQHIDGVEDGYVHDNRYIGGISVDDTHATAYVVKAITLTTLLKDIDTVVFLKTDCENGEWDLFADPAMAKVQYVCGEYHGAYGGGVAHLEACLPLHDVTAWPVGGDPLNMGLFEGTLKA